MSDYTIYAVDNAPEGSKASLEKSQKAFGSIPNLHGVMAESPELLKGYQTLHQLATETSFNADELTVVWQAINVEHACHYCVPAHTAIAKNMKVGDEVINALRDKTQLPSKKLETLRNVVLELTRERGHLSEDSQSEFFEQGFTRQNLLEIVLILAQKVMSNYTNHLAETPVDEGFKKFDWQPS